MSSSLHTRRRSCLVFLPILCSCSDWGLVVKEDTGDEITETNDKNRCDWESQADGLVALEAGGGGNGVQALNQDGELRVGKHESTSGLGGEFWLDFQVFITGEMDWSGRPDIQVGTRDNPNLGVLWQTPLGSLERDRPLFAFGKRAASSGYQAYILSFQEQPPSGTSVVEADGFLVTEGFDVPTYDFYLEDINADGATDLLIHAGYDVNMYLGPLDGERDALEDYDLTFFNALPAEMTIDDPSLADVNDDGYADLLGTNFGVNVLFGPLTSTLTSDALPDYRYDADLHPEFATRMAEGGDLSGDGRVDLLLNGAALLEEQFAAVLLTDIEAGTATSEDAGTLFHHGDASQPGSIYAKDIGDVDGDGFGDLVASFIPEDGERNNQAFVLFGPFTSPTMDIKAEAGAIITLDDLDRDESVLEAQTAGDLNGDGAQDFLLNLRNTDALVLFLGCDGRG